MVAWRMEQIASVRRIDIEKDPRDNDGLLFEQFLEKGLTDHE